MPGKDTLKTAFRLLPLAASLAFALSLSPAAMAASARCFMHGIIIPTAGVKPALSDMLRLHFDATDQKKCERMMAAYCQYNVLEKTYSPERLKGSFKADMDKPEEVTYTFGPSCKLIASPEPDEAD